MIALGAVTALGMVIVSAARPVGPLRSNKRQTTFSNYLSSNGEKPQLLETDAPVNDRERLKRHFSPGMARSTFSRVPPRATCRCRRPQSSSWSST